MATNITAYFAVLKGEVKHSRYGHKHNSLLQSLEIGPKHSRGGHKQDSLLLSVEMGAKHSSGGHERDSLLQSLEKGQNILEMATNVTAYFVA